MNREGWEAAALGATIAGTLALAVKAVAWPGQRTRVLDDKIAQERNPSKSDSEQTGSDGLSNVEVSTLDRTSYLSEPVIPSLDLQETLPARPTQFTGREQELDQLLAILNPTSGGQTRPSVAAVAGMGGIGKTSLAVEVAHEARGRGWFSMTVFLDLRGYAEGATPLTPAEVLETALHSLGTSPGDIPINIEERSSAYRYRLDEVAKALGSPILVVADNASTASQVEPLLPGAGDHRLIITSRTHLDLLSGVRRVDLDTLGRQEAVSLLVAILQSANPSDPRISNPQGLAQVAKGCGYLPLALWVAGALLVRPPHPPLDRLARRLSDRRKRLDALQLPKRTVGVRSAFDLSFNNLNLLESKLFVLLGLNPGRDISTSAVAGMTWHERNFRYSTEHEEDVENALEGLSAAHLLTRHDEHRWRMHDLVVDYARERMKANSSLDHNISEEYQEARDRLYVYYLNGAISADNIICLTSIEEGASYNSGTEGWFINKESALEWLDTEFSNLLATVRAADYTGDATVAANLPLALSNYLMFRRQHHVLLAVTEIAQEAAHAMGYDQQEGTAWNNLGYANYKLRSFEDSIDAFNNAQEIFRRIGDRHAEGSTWNNIGAALSELGRFDEALVAQSKARAIFQDLGERSSDAVASANLGSALLDAGRVDEAIATHSYDLARCQEAGDQDGEVAAWNNLGYAFRGAGRIDEAITAHTNAQRICQQLGNQQAEAVSLSQLGNVLWDAQRAGEAVAAYTTVIAIYQRLGDQDAEAGAWETLGHMQRYAQWTGDAVGSHAAARAIYQQLRDRYGEARAWNNVGAALREVGRAEEAVTTLIAACTLSEELGDRQGEAAAWLNLSATLREAGRADEAGHAFERAKLLDPDLVSRRPSRRFRSIPGRSW